VIAGDRRGCGEDERQRQADDGRPDGAEEDLSEDERGDARDKADRERAEVARAQACCWARLRLSDIGRLLSSERGSSSLDRGPKCPAAGRDHRSGAAAAAASSA